MFRRIRLHFRPVQCDVAQLDQSGLLRQAQHLGEQLSQGIQVDAPELADACVVWLVAPSDDPERHVLPRLLFDLPG